MRVLLIGANGYLGRFVADRLLADPAVQLTALGRGDDADVRFDLASGSPGALTRFLDAVHPGVVVNCAGATRGGARDLTRHNTVAVATVCEALRRSGCGARLVQIGCGAEYGPSQPGSSTAEDAVPRPGGPYGVSKLAATELVLGSGLDAVVLRVFSPAGPGTPAGSPLGRLAEAMRRAMQSGDGELKLGGLGVQRDFVDVRDVARAVHAASLSAAQGVINIGSGRAVRLRDAAAVLARVAGYGGALHELDGPPGPGGPALRATIGHPRSEARPRGPGRVPVPGRLRRLAAGRRAHRPRPARLAAPDQPRGIPRRHLDGGGMPHLTRTAKGTAGTDRSGVGFGVPGYAHPLVAPLEWAELTRPGTPLHWVVLNVDNGPGARPDPHCLEAAGRLRNGGVRVLGHLDTAYGDPAVRRDWSPTPAAISTGTRSTVSCSAAAPPSASSLPESRAGRSARSGRCARRATSCWATAPTRIPATPRAPTSWSPSAGPGATTAGRRWPSGPRTIRPSASATSCTGCPAATWRRRCASPAGRARPRSTSPTARTAAARDDPWETVPGYWDEIVSRIGTGVSE